MVIHLRDRVELWQLGSVIGSITVLPGENDVEPLAALAKAELAGAWTVAANLVSTALARDPTCIPANRAIDAYWRAGRYSEARSLIASDAIDPLLLLFGRALEQQEQEAAVDGEIALDPRNPRLFVDRGLLREKFVRRAEAREDYRLAIELDPEVYLETGVAFQVRAEMHYKAGRLVAAADDFLRAKQLLPDEIMLLPFFANGKRLAELDSAEQ